MDWQFQTVAEDIEWLHQQWWLEPDNLLDADIRRGGATLRRLLLDGQGAVALAWRHFGFAGQPSVTGPDVEALLRHSGFSRELTASLIAGGGRVNGMDLSMIGIHRVDNPSTGVPAAADEGFAVAVASIARSEKGGIYAPIDQELTRHVEREWKLTEYLDAPGAIRRGKLISRRDILQFFCKLAGSVHLDIGTNRKRPLSFEFIKELRGKVHSDWRDGLVFEMLSIGQALGKSRDLLALAEKIKEKRD